MIEIILLIVGVTTFILLAPYLLQVALGNMACLHDAIQVSNSTYVCKKCGRVGKTLFGPISWTDEFWDHGKLIAFLKEREVLK